MSEISKESRARLAQHELQITEEAHSKLRAFWLEEAVSFAAQGRTTEAHNMLLQVKALDTIRMMVRTPVDDLEIEKAVAEATGAKPN